MSRAGMGNAWRSRPVSTFFATGFGIGMLPLAPGTWGSLEGLLLAALFGSGSLRLAGLAFVVTIVGIAVSGRVEEVCGVKDPSQVVIDEVAGQLLASVPAAGSFGSRRLILLAVSFALFRLLDIWKPWPIRRLEKLPGGWGIMLDDVLAGILAGAITLAAGKSL